MLRRIVAPLLVLGCLGCAELPPAPGTGTGGVGGSDGAGTGGSGAMGGTGGAAGISGSGGSAGTDACTAIVLAPDADTEVTDSATGKTANGSVCSDGACSTGFDPVDRWSAVTCGGLNIVSLSWTNDDDTSDLDWAAFGPEDALIEESATRTFTDNLEEKTVSFEDGEPLTIEVRAHSTSGLVRTYSLTVSPTD